VTDDQRNAVLETWRRGLRPLARLLLRSGITWREAGDVGKKVFVDVATEDYGLHGRPTSISRVAILTGMSRREVGRLRRGRPAGDNDALVRMDTATRVLTGWHLDPQFQDAEGRPLELAYDGPGASFLALARRYAGDIAPVTIMKELARVGAIVDGDGGRLRVVKRYYLTPGLDPARTLQAGSMLEDFGEAVRHSLLRTEAEPPRFVGRASNRAVRATAAGAFGEFVQGEAQAFLERVDAWLSAHEVDADAARRQRGVRLGLGVFEIRDEP
jgi:hypothetical protein